MSKDLSRVTLIGRLGQEPTAKHTPQGTLIVQFTVATGRPYKDGEGNQRKDTEVLHNRLRQTLVVGGK